MKEKNGFEKREVKLFMGKTHILIVALVCTTIFAVLATALGICISSLGSSSEQSRTALATAVELEMQHIEATSSNVTMGPEALDYVDLPLMHKLGQASGEVDPTAFHEAELMLEECRSKISSTQKRCSYFYFPASEIVVGTSAYKGTEYENAHNLFTSDSVGKFPDTLGTYVQWLGTTDEGEMYSVCMRMLAPGAYYIYVRFSRPNYELSDVILGDLSGAEMYTYDRYGNVHALENNQILKGVFTYEDFGNEHSDTFFFEHNGAAYIGAYCTFDARQTRLAVFFRDTALETRNTAVRLLVFSAMGLLAVSLFIVLLSVRRAYRPISQIVSRLPEANDSGIIRDDVGIIAKTLTDWDIKLKEQEKLLHNSWLLRFVRGASTERFAAYQDSWLAKEDGKSFALVAMRVDNNSTNQPLTELEFECAIEEILAEWGYKFRFAHDKDYLILIVEMESEKKPTDLAESMNALQEKMPLLGISAFISTRANTFRELHRCYDEVMIVSEYCAAMEKYATVVRYDEVSHAINRTSSPGPDFNGLKLLSDYISSLSERETLEQFDSLIYQLSEYGRHPIHSGDMMFPLLTNTIAITFYDLILPGDINKASIQQHADKVRAASSTEELRDILKESLHNFVLQNSSPSYDKERFIQVREYINSKFRDSNLSAGMVADVFNVSQSAVTRMFKKYNQTGFLEYVHQLRVTEAIELLRSTKLTEAEIASRVGYNNVITMIRAFKNYAHTTPSHIRNMPSD